MPKPEGTKLDKLLAELRAEREKVVAKSAPHRKEREALLKKIQPLEAELRPINQKIKQIEQPALGNIDVQIAQIAKALGGRSLNEAPKGVAR